jgi:NADH-quinone oxidoreductase subunit K
MSSTLTQALWLCAALFALGWFCVLLRRTLLFVLIGLEVMLGSASLAFVVAGARWQQADGQILYLMVLTLAAAEVAVGLALALQVARRFGSLELDQMTVLR